MGPHQGPESGGGREVGEGWGEVGWSGVEPRLDLCRGPGCRCDCVGTSVGTCV